MAAVTARLKKCDEGRNVGARIGRARRIPNGSRMLRRSARGYCLVTVSVSLPILVAKPRLLPANLLEGFLQAPPRLEEPGGSRQQDQDHEAERVGVAPLAGQVSGAHRLG